jgi:hypothetical protein
MEDRKRRFDDRTEVRGRIAEALKKVVGHGGFFDGVHVFTPHADVPDDSALRLVVLPPDQWYAREETRIAVEAVLDAIQKNGPKPRYRGNRLLFLAPDHAVLGRLKDAAATTLAWGSIVDDVKDGRLTIDNLQQKQAEKALRSAEDVLPRAARECYKWLLCPVQEAPTDPKPMVEAFALTTTGGTLGAEIERVCLDNELVIQTWSPIHLRTMLKDLYWKGGQSAASASGFFEDTLRYLYLPRFRNRDVLLQAIRSGVASRDFFGTAYGEEAHRPAPEVPGSAPDSPDVGGLREPSAPPFSPGSGPAPGPVSAKPKSFYASAEVPPATAKMRLVQIADEIVSVLCSDPNASVRLVVEISAEFPEGASDTVKRAVSENARSLELKSADWE